MHKLRLPRLGQTMTQGAVLEWLKKENEPYEIGELLYELEAEKSTYQVEAKRPGSIARIVAEMGQVLPTGSLLAVVADPGESLSKSEIDAAVAEEKPIEPVAVAAESASQTQTAASKPLPERKGPIKIVPKARSLAKEYGLELEMIEGTGKNGTITVKDVERAKADIESGAPRIRERKPVVGLVRANADAVKRSWTQIPQFVQMIWVDADALFERRLADGPAVKASHGLDLSLNDLILHAAIQAVLEAPEVNSTFTENEIIYFEDVNVSVAIATDAGLMVPVLKRAQTLSLGDLAREIRELARRARAGELTPEDMQGGTLTVSNLGMFGVETGTPIITPPQAAIVFLGTTVERPVVRNGNIQVRKFMGVSIAYDHRILDGRTASKYTMAVKKRLESAPEKTEGELRPDAGGKVSTLAAKLAAKEGVDLSKVQGTGVRGRVMRADVAAVSKESAKSGGGFKITTEEAIRAVGQTIVENPQLTAVIKGDGIHLQSN